MILLKKIKLLQNNVLYYEKLQLVYPELFKEK